MMLEPPTAALALATRPLSDRDKEKVEGAPFPEDELEPPRTMAETGRMLGPSPLSSSRPRGSGVRGRVKNGRFGVGGGLLRGVMGILME
jgi:hypothetical protein